MAKSMDTKGIYLLASYPKSGNTWTRLFITAMKKYQLGESLTNEEIHQSITDKDDAINIDINELSTDFMVSSRYMNERILGLSLADFNFHEIDSLRSYAFKWYVDQVNKVSYHKVHDAYYYDQFQQPLFPSGKITGVLYLVRNPFDVAVSFANHLNSDIDYAINMMGSSKGGLNCNPRKLVGQLRQHMMSWSGHVESWWCQQNIKVQLIRYEDMKQNPLEAFSTIAAFLQLDTDTRVIEKALQMITMEKMQSQEKNSGFKEKFYHSKVFFRKGIVGDWQQKLSAQQIERIVTDHGEMMLSLGYIDDQRHPMPCISQSH